MVPHGFPGGAIWLVPVALEDLPASFRYAKVNVIPKVSKVLKEECLAQTV